TACKPAYPSRDERARTGHTAGRGCRMSHHPTQRPTSAPHTSHSPSHDAPILSDTSQVQLRARCPICRGRRTLDTVGYARCDVCGKAHHGDTRHGAHELPYAHIPREGTIRLRYEPC